MTSLPPPVQSVLELFLGPLANVRFADIDAAGLSKLAAEVEAAAADVHEHESRLTELRQTLAQRQEALLALAQQALAYARVYAENDEPLLDAVNRISLPRAAKPRKALPSKGAARGEAVGEAVDSALTADAAPLAGDAASLADAASLPDKEAGVDGEASTDATDADEADASAVVRAPVRGPRKGRAAAQRATN